MPQKGKENSKSYQVGVVVLIQHQLLRTNSQLKEMCSNWREELMIRSWELEG